ncbi:MAG: radical SAM protein [Thermoplasmata archaeon]|nr:radical SAM protein [Thermoplasmata archaeon]
MARKVVECRSALTPSRLPGLDWALNPYRGCEHRCAYCYAQDVTRFEAGRPWGDSVEVRANIASRLKGELEKRVDGVYGLGTVTDPYQPAEREYELSRACLAMLRRFEGRVSVLTKSDMVLRDLDLLGTMPGAEVGVTVSCVDEKVASVIEPGAPTPGRRFEALAGLASAGVDCYLMIAPVIPGVSDSEAMLAGSIRRAKDAGVRRVMWDMYNPKPIAHSRLAKALEGTELGPVRAPSVERTRAIRSLLRRECESCGMTLVDAF